MTTKTLRLPDALTNAVRDVGRCEHVEESTANLEAESLDLRQTSMLPILLQRDTAAISRPTMSTAACDSRFDCRPQTERCIGCFS